MEISSGSVLSAMKALFKPLSDFLSKRLFYRAYEISTLYRNHRDAFGIPPDELIEGLEYKVICGQYHLSKKMTLPMLWLRAKNGKTFSKIALLVTAGNNKISYQNYLTLFDIGDIPIQTALPSIPFRDLKFKVNKVNMLLMVSAPYDDIKLKLMELYDDTGAKIDLPYGIEEIMIHPFDNLAVAMGLERGDIEKWGEIFNLEFIEMEIKQEKKRLIGRMFGDFYSLRKYLFSFNWLVKAIFWSKNLFNAKQLTTQFIKYIDEHEKHKKWKAQNHTN
jgi:hypothetical protein